MRQDNRGITLVEMIIAIAACAIVISAASLFIRNALQGYRLASDAIDLQIEAQVLMEQLSSWVMEGNYVLYEEYGDPAGSQYYFIIYNIPRDISLTEEILNDWGVKESDLTGERWMRVFWCDKNNKLYMYKPKDGTFPKPTTEGSKLNISEIMTDKAKEEDRHLISNYVDDFLVSIEPSDGPPNKVTITLQMRAGIQRYDFSYEINIRNAPYAVDASAESP